MAKATQRVFAMVAAVVFLASSLAFSGYVIWQLANQNDTKTATDITNNSNQEPATMLQGTKLADFTPVAEANALQKIDLVEGTGEEVKPGATITAHYTGAYAVNGEIFESSKDSGQPATFPLNSVIPGWTEGVPGMKVGGKRRLIIPGAQAYGVAPEGYTPGSTDRPMGTLVFDIELVSIGE